MTPTARRALLLAAVLVALPAHADETDDVARLREEAAALRQSLEQLEAKIQTLERAEGARPAASPAPRPEKQPELPLVSVQRSWSEVRPGVAKERVSALLGAPEKVLRINGDLVWYYVYPGAGRGSVFFSTGDTVTAVQAPRPGW